MKTLTTLTAIAALIAGISIASAQTSTAPKSGGAMGSSSTTGGPPPQAMGTGKFCSTGSAGAKNCTFATLQACQAAAKSGETCAANPKDATTGSQN